MSSIEDRFLKSPIPKEAPELAGFFLSPKLKFFQSDGAPKTEYFYGVVCHDFAMEIAKTLSGRTPFINDISEPSSCQTAYKQFLQYMGIDLSHILSIKMRLLQQATGIEMAVEYTGCSSGGDTIIIPIKNPDRYALMLVSEMKATEAKLTGFERTWGCGTAERYREGEYFQMIIPNILNVLLFKDANDTRTDSDDDN